MVIQETQSQIEQARQQVTEAKQVVEQQKKSIPPTTQAQLRGQKAQAGLAGRNYQRNLEKLREQVGQKEQAINDYESQLNQYEQNVQDYLQKDSGKLQYAKENNIQGTPIYDRVVKGGTLEIVGYKYSTPYGEVSDYSRGSEIARGTFKAQQATEEKLSEIGSSMGITNIEGLYDAGVNINNPFINIQSDLERMDRTTKVQTQDILGDIIKPEPSSALLSSDKSLSSQSNINNNGLGSITGASISNSLPMVSGKSNNSGIRSYFDRGFNTAKDDIEKANGKNLSITQNGKTITTDIPLASAQANLILNPQPISNANIPKVETTNINNLPSYPRVQAFGGVVQPTLSFINKGLTDFSSDVVSGLKSVGGASVPILEGFANQQVKKVGRDIEVTSYLTNQVSKAVSPYVSATGKYAKQQGLNFLKNQADKVSFTAEVTKNVEKRIEPYVRQGLKLSKEQIELIAKEEANKQARLISTGFFVFDKTVKPTASFVGENILAPTGEVIKSQVSSFAKSQAPLIAGGILGTEFVYNKAVKPFVSPLFSFATTKGTEELNKQVQRTNQITLLGGLAFDKGIKPTVGFVNTGLTNFSGDVVKYVVKPTAKEIFIDSYFAKGMNVVTKPLQDIFYGQETAINQGKETFNVGGEAFGYNLPVSKSSSRIYRGVEGFENLVGGVFADIGKTTGEVTKGQIGIKPAGTYTTPNSFFESETGFNVRTITPEQSQQSAKDFGGRVKIAFQVGEFAGTDLVSPYTIKVASGIVGSVISPKESLVGFVKENPLDVTLLGGLGLLKGIKYGRTPLSISERLVPETSDKARAIIRGDKSVVRRFTNEEGKKVVQTLYNDVKGVSTTTKEGVRPVITTRFRNLFGMKPLYKAGGGGVKTYGETLKYLTNKGVEESKARNLLRLRKPSVTKDVFTGKAIVEVVGEESPIIKIRGIEKSQKVKGFVNDIPFAGGEGRIRFIDSIGKETGSKANKDLLRFSQSVKEAYLSKTGVPYSKIKQAGKTTKKFDILTAVEERGKTNVPIGISEDLIVGKEATKYKELDIVKQVNPIKRKLQTSNADIFVIEGEPVITISDETIGKVGLQGGKATKSGSNVLEQIYKTDQAVSSGVSSIVKDVKISSPPITGGVVSDIKSSSSLNSLSQSSYAGTGQYERTQDGMTIRVKDIPATIISNKDLVKTSTFEVGKSNTKQIDILKVEDKQQPSFRQPNKVGLKQPEQLKELTDLSFKEVGKLKTSQAQKTQQRTRQTTKQEFGRPTPQKPNKPTDIFKLPKTSLVKRLLKKVESEPESFSVFGKRFGKDIELLKTTSKEKAEKGLFNFLKGSLGRSGKILKNGEALSFGDLKLFQNKEFRPSKADKNRVVQRSEFSLGTRQEVGEIQLFKRKAKKKKLNWFS